MSITLPFGFLAASVYPNTYSVDFDGVNDYASFDDSSFPSGDSNYSMSVWVKFDSLDNYALPVGWGTSVNYQCVGINVDSSKFKHFWWNESCTGTSTISTGQWYHVVATWDGSDMKLYVDGALETTTTPSSTLNITLRTGLIGKWDSGYTPNGVDGNIDEVAIWSSALSAANVTSIYNSGTPTDLTSLSPIAWWKMGDGDTYPTLTDSGSGGNNGTMTNMAEADIEEDTP